MIKNLLIKDSVAPDVINKRQMAEAWAAKNKRLSKVALDHLMAILEDGPVNIALLGDFKVEHGIECPLGAWIDLEANQKHIRRYVARTSPIGQPVVALADQVENEDYWRKYRGSSLLGDDADLWGRLGLDRAKTGIRPVRYAIFRAVIQLAGENIKRQDEDGFYPITGVITELERLSGFRFVDFFGVTAMDACRNKYGSASLAWKYIEDKPPFLFVKAKGGAPLSDTTVSPRKMKILLERAKAQTPEEIDFQQLASDFDVGIECVQIAYLECLKKLLHESTPVKTTAPRTFAFAQRQRPRPVEIRTMVRNLADDFAEGTVHSGTIERVARSGSGFIVRFTPRITGFLPVASLPETSEFLRDGDCVGKSGNFLIVGHKVKDGIQQYLLNVSSEPVRRISRPAPEGRATVSQQDQKADKAAEKVAAVLDVLERLYKMGKLTKAEYEVRRNAALSDVLGA